MQNQEIYCTLPGIELINKLWIPQLIFSNDLMMTNIEKDGIPSLTVRRREQPILTSDNEITENYLFEGATNQLMLNNTYDLELHCDFNLENYPFDLQVCYIQVITSTITILCWFS